MTAPLAILGAPPRFAPALATNQAFGCDWPHYVALMRDIFARQYYTNHGPLAQALEARVQRHLGVAHALAVTNAFIALALAGQALEINGPLLLPALGRPGTLHALDWIPAMPCFCDVDAASGLATPATVAAALTAATIPPVAMLAVQPWGDAVDLPAFTRAALRARLPLFVDATDGFGSRAHGRPLGGSGLLEVVSVVPGGDPDSGTGALLCTDDDRLAARVRNLRSNYGMGERVPVTKTSNGRLSEMQAALALHRLERAEEERDGRALRGAMYRLAVTGISGLALRRAVGVEVCNEAFLLALLEPTEFGLSRDELVRTLRAEGISVDDRYGVPLSRRQARRDGSAAAPLPQAERYAQRLFGLPLAESVGAREIEVIGTVLQAAQRHAPAVRAALGAADGAPA